MRLQPQHFMINFYINKLDLNTILVPIQTLRDPYSNPLLSPNPDPNHNLILPVQLSETYSPIPENSLPPCNVSIIISPLTPYPIEVRPLNVIV